MPVRPRRKSASERASALARVCACVCGQTGRCARGARAPATTARTRRPGGVGMLPQQVEIAEHDKQMRIEKELRRRHAQLCDEPSRLLTQVGDAMHGFAAPLEEWGFVLPSGNVTKQQRQAHEQEMLGRLDATWLGRDILETLKLMDARRKLGDGHSSRTATARARGATLWSSSTRRWGAGRRRRRRPPTVTARRRRTCRSSCRSRCRRTSSSSTRRA